MAQPSEIPAVLDFDFDEFRKSSYVSRPLFLESVQQALLHRPPHAPLEKVRLWFEFTNDPSISSGVDSIVQTVTAAKARALEFDFSQDPAETVDPYKFPFSEIMNSSVEVLALSGCDLKIPRSRSFDSIREMQLIYFECGGDEEIENFVVSCANLEKLVLKEGSDLRRFKIVSPKLKNFTFGSWEDETSVEICAPSLESIEFCVGIGGVFVVSDTSSLVSAKVDFQSRSWRSFTCWSNVLCFLSDVERLTIQNMWTWFMGESTAKISTMEKKPGGESHADNQLFEELLGEIKLGEAVFSETFAFHNVKHLELLTGYLRDDVLGLVIVLKKCPQLVNLTLVYKYHSDLDEQVDNEEITDRPSDLDLACLRQVEMKDYRGTMNEQNVARLLMRHSPDLEKVVACPPKEKGSRPPFVLWMSMSHCFKR